jgi:GNAT superfamily N-acetyltransferase
MRDVDAVTAVERTLFVWPEIDGIISHLRISGVTGRIARIDHPRLNAVGLARLDPRDADATIDAVGRTYTDAGVRAAWLIGPTSTPIDLSARLCARGILPHGELSGLVLDDLAGAADAKDPVRVREVPAAEALALAGLVARGLGLPADAAAVFVRASVRPRSRTHLFVAALGSDPAPVAFGFLELVGDPPLALLGGAGTLAEHRGRGAYRALVRARIAVAHAQGARVVVVQAHPTTSAPILHRLGFREVCRIAVHLRKESARTAG